jgi:hypothetical protein
LQCTKWLGFYRSAPFGSFIDHSFEGDNMSYIELAYAIVLQAVEEYKLCYKRKKPVGHLVRFFNSQWCDNLLINTGVTGKEILKHLKRECRAKYCKTQFDEE